MKKKQINQKTPNSVFNTVFINPDIYIYIYIYIFHFEVRVASGDRSVVI